MELTDAKTKPGPEMAACKVASGPAASIESDDSWPEEATIEQPNFFALQAEEYDRQKAKLDEIQQNRTRLLVSTGSLLERAWPPESFLIGPKLLPKNGRMLISGTTGTGKSVLTLNLAASLATGAPMFGIMSRRKDAHLGQPKFPILQESTVLYIDYEVPHSIRAQNRLAPLVKHFPERVLNNLFFAPHPTRYRLQNESGEELGKGSFDALKRLVEDVRPDVLILDPLSSTHSLQENSNEIKQVFNKVDKLIDEYECAVIVVVHASPKVPRTKNGEKIQRDTIEEIRGHTSQGDWADCHMHLSALPAEQEDEDEKLIDISFGKHRHCRKPTKRTLFVNFRTMEVRPAMA